MNQDSEHSAARDRAEDGPSPREPLRSLHTSNLPEMLEQLGISLLVTTYQAGKLVMLRPEAACVTVFSDVVRESMATPHSFATR